MMCKVITPFLFIVMLFITACSNQDEHIVAACMQELDQAYLRVGKPTGTDFKTLSKIQQEAGDEIYKMVYGENKLDYEGTVGISTSVLSDHINIVISRNGKESSETQWRPPK